MLSKIRIILSILSFSLITFCFLDFAGITGSHGWLSKIQFVPALLSSNLIILSILILCTLLFGRVYCSILCPMGVLQDIVARISRIFKGGKKRYHYSPEKKAIRWSILSITIIAFLCGFTFLLGLLDPYSSYGRIAVHLFRPIYMQGNNLLESLFSRFDNHSFYQVDISIIDVVSLVIALITFGIICFLAWKHGRTWCNTICPVGTLLGFLSRFSLLKIHIDTEKCNHCGLCATACKAACINSREQQIDYSRCVNCFNCLDVCKQKALIYASSFKRERSPAIVDKTNQSKRRFLIASVATVSVAVPKLTGQTGKAITTSGYGKIHKKETPVIPPGAVSLKHFHNHCTSCHLCISKCPAQILKPAFMEYGLEGIMQPTVNFDKGFCDYNCTICGNICPNNAITPLTIEQKHLTQIGHAVFIKERCMVYQEGANCGACSEQCPTQAINMIPFEQELSIPQVDPSKCIGCGSCEYICPATPLKAIHIEGNLIQKMINTH